MKTVKVDMYSKKGKRMVKGFTITLRNGVSPYQALKVVAEQYNVKNPTRQGKLRMAQPGLYEAYDGSFLKLNFLSIMK